MDLSNEWLRRVPIGLACASLVVALLPSAASADSKRVHDRRDTFGGLSPKVSAPKDIRWARFTNKRTRVVAVVGLRRLWPHSTGWTQLNLSRGSSKWYSLTVVRRKDGSQDVRQRGIRQCPRVTARYRVRKNQVRFSIPQHCLTDGGRHRWEMSAYVGGLPIRGANAWDGSRSVHVRYR